MTEVATTTLVTRPRDCSGGCAIRSPCSEMGSVLPELLERRGERCGGVACPESQGNARRPTKHVRFSGITWKPYVLSLPLTPTRLADGLGLGSALLHCTGGDAPRVAHGVRQSVPPYLPPAGGRFRLTICTGIHAKKIPETAASVNSQTRGQRR